MITARFERRDGYVWLRYPSGWTPGRDHLDALAHALRLHRWARHNAEALELLDAGWTPARTGWDDPTGKHLDCPQWRALTIARKDARKDGR